MIPVTKPFSPPIEEYQSLLKDVWDRNWYTNNGPLVNKLELELKNYLNQNHLLYVSNGTIALQLALKALGITKKVITTPFSYVATTSSIVWEGCTPIFVDIDPETLNIDPTKIEQYIDSDTEAILATHCFGNPCDVEAIAKIAKKNNLKVIYDAAHCFGTTFRGKSIFSFGDISTVSFHATKLYHTVEGGAVFTQNTELLEKMSYMRNFGHETAETYSGIGINGKNSEFHAAMGLVNLKYVSSILERRKQLSARYDFHLKSLEINRPKTLNDASSNYSYYPLVFATERELLAVKNTLEKNLIYPRRYFYPSLNKLPYVGGSFPLSEEISTRVLCLPLYHDLHEHEVEFICRIVARTLNFPGL
jgi:dTDP-4-amino-4,6-dideoxygalactose transaminase